MKLIETFLNVTKLGIHHQKEVQKVLLILK